MELYFYTISMPAALDTRKFDTICIGIRHHEVWSNNLILMYNCMRHANMDIDTIQIVDRRVEACFFFFFSFFLYCPIEVCNIIEHNTVQFMWSGTVFTLLSWTTPYLVPARSKVVLFFSFSRSLEFSLPISTCLIDAVATTNSKIIRIHIYHQY